MTKKIKAMIAIGGTGGHVFPGYNLATHLIQKNYNVKLVSDKRGYKYLKEYKDLNISILPSSPLKKKNIFELFFSVVLIFLSVLRSLIFLISHKPAIIFGMGGYASFPICIAASILRIKFVIYENNLILGRANKYLLPFANKILVSHKGLEGIPNKYHYKIFEIGNIIKKEIINYPQDKHNKLENHKVSILILGGSQAAKIFAETLPNIFKKSSDSGISLKIFQQCLPDQNNNLKFFYEKCNIDYEIFNFSKNLIEYFSKVNLAITRSGSSMLAELSNVGIPFVAVPLPTSADNHQLKNAIFYKNKNFGFMLEEKDLNEKLFYLIKDIYENKSILDKIINNLKQYSDKDVYNNIDKILKEIFNEKN
tara:strand:+ start:2262 stop:3359 length:1098 start_codon:yes stop_codon:yes gene_type:complete